MKSFKSTCSYCGVGCNIIVNTDRDGRMTLEGDPDSPVNKGMLCSKGMNLHYTVMDKSDRLLYPQMRMSKDMPLQIVSWDDALSRAAAVFSSIIKRFGPDAVAFYVSGQCLTEEYYIINKLIKGFIGSNNIDTNSRLCMSSAVVGYKLSLGEDAVPTSYEDIELADTFLVTGANPAWCHPIMWRRVEAHKAANPDVKIIVVDPRKTQTCAYADIHLQINPGTDITLHHAIGRALIEKDMVDNEFIANNTDGFETYKELVFQKTIKEAARICGVKSEDIYWTAEYIGRSNGFISMWTMGLNQSVVGVNKNVSLINLNLITGHIGKPGSGPFSLTGQPNAMGGREVGGLANLLPAHRNLLDPKDREDVEKFWGGTKIAPKPGLTATEMFQALETGKLKAIWIVCTNPLVSLPDARLAEKALSKANFVVVQEISDKSDTLKYADLVLPAAAWAEKEGTMTNSERRISYLHPVVPPPGEALPDTEIINRFATKMGYETNFGYKNAEEVFLEHCQLTKGTNIDISGLNYKILQDKGSVRWPYPEGATEDTPRLFTDGKFYTANKRAKISSVPDENQSERTDEHFPLILTTGRIRDQWHTMTKTGKVNKLNQHLPKPFLEIHPADAFSRDIAEGDLVEIFNNRGNVRVSAKVTSDIKRGVVFLPMHWGKSFNSDLTRANNLTSNLIDPVSKEPDFKFSAVQVFKYQKPNQKIVIVGAGAGAFGFVKSYRNVNESDEIAIFSKEDQPIYNRVMLPDYVSGVQTWDQLIKLKEEEEPTLKIQIYKGNSIESIDKIAKTVTDSKGVVHPYDVLILGMGSRANVPKDVPMNLKGMFTMRSRQDADRFKDYLFPGSHVVVVGGGVLGIEMAGSLREMNHRVTVIQRSSRLMDRQFDNLGSHLLHEELVDRNIEVFYNDEVQTYFGKEKVEGILLRSGHKISCDICIVAIGTLPNMELARDAGLVCKRGVVINERLQTSDSSIFAIGEIAEFKNMLYGITAAAEQQADVLAQFLNGDDSAIYNGSTLMNILKVHGTNICSIGLTETPEDPEYEEVVFIDKARRYYKKCIIHKDMLVGAILIGDKTEFLEFKEMIQNRVELSEKRLSLLRSGKAPEPILGKLVCSCNNVGEGNIIAKIKGGCEGLAELCKASGAGMGCGSCKPEVKAILERELVIA